MRYPRDLTVLNAVDVNALSIEALVDLLFAVPQMPVAATDMLAGLPVAVLSRESAEMAQVYKEATIVQLDGMPVAKMAWRKGHDCGHYSGMDIMDATIEKGVAFNSRHFFYGGRDEAQLEKLKAHFHARYPGANIVDGYSPPFRPLTEAEDEALVRRICQCRPDFIWVGIGSPKQDLWMRDHREKIPGCVMLGVGAAFNFLTEEEKKAPDWMADHCMEWLFRLVCSPKRLWRRYVLGGFKVIFYTLKDALWKPWGRRK
jgi:N-acetylglucosaminyldiphosphoundecaprenol N-acetyl-beta-D-mannosaminyltransferase